ncbi:hypothetical protein SDC9_198822 [bioreactor metagenome]|uniref:Uncharacterized protein n=1 Tax=bioreactor metagenome TaxID=1076179 RepID=A0A645IJ72_9ZZZZ
MLCESGNSKLISEFILSESAVSLSLPAPTFSPNEEKVELHETAIASSIFNAP